MARVAPALGQQSCAPRVFGLADLDGVVFRERAPSHLLARTVVCERAVGERRWRFNARLGRPPENRAVTAALKAKVARRLDARFLCSSGDRYGDSGLLLVKDARGLRSPVRDVPPQATSDYGSVELGAICSLILIVATCSAPFASAVSLFVSPIPVRLVPGAILCFQFWALPLDPLPASRKAW